MSPEVHSWPVTLGNATFRIFYGIESVHVGELGSACVVLVHGTAGSLAIPGYGVSRPIFKHTEVVRVEPDDGWSPAVAVMDASVVPVQTGIAHLTPLRAELWAMNNTYDAALLVLARSRPSQDEGSIAYKADPHANPFGAWCFAVDDSGRAVLAMTEGIDAPITTRVLLLN